MDAVTALTVVCLARNRFVELLGPMEQIMQREKSDQVSRLGPSQRHPHNSHLMLNQLAMHSVKRSAPQSAPHTTQPYHSAGKRTNAV